MHIVFFGTYHQAYAKNIALKKGLIDSEHKVTEIHQQVSLTRLETAEDFGLLKWCKRIGNKIISSILLTRKAFEIPRDSEALVVLHPGHLDLPLAFVISRIKKIPLVFDASISPYDTNILGRKLGRKDDVKSKLIFWGEKALLNLCDVIITDTDLLKKFFIKTFHLPSKKITVVPLGTDTKLYFPTKKTNSSKKTKVLFFGMYNPLHGAMHIVKAAKLLKQNPDISIHLIGDGPQKQALLKYAQKNRLDNLTFDGFMPESELVKEIQKSDIVLGTFSNNRIMKRVIPNKVIGAIACKKPVITSEYPVLKDYFKHEKSIIFCEPESAKQLAKAIIDTSSNQELRRNVAQKGYEIFTKHFTPQHMADQLIQSITTL